ncbi:hypothetical protein BLNAU_14447 [Blattamonas nauphoetae]|uniref:Uncharacterized protein n=1 Tax=Blattamonas nauphoetae TaxID=2049346 RepID=A0ABQ9XFA5_9EUKA|nr:hypothetical protein BLNAU_14447 [Blattamonas nauphoetae]
MDGITTILEDKTAEQWDDEVDVTEEDRRDTARMLEGLANEEDGTKVKTAKKQKNQNGKETDERAMLVVIVFSVIFKMVQFIRCGARVFDQVVVQIHQTLDGHPLEVGKEGKERVSENADG